MTKGKQTCDPSWILAFWNAYLSANKTGKKIIVEGYSGWYVSPISKEEIE